MRGASALESTLKRHRDAPVRVYVVWEPILATDGAPPTNPVLASIPDIRARQYWDPGHLVAKRMAADARPPQPVQECCVRNEILWDIAAVYPRGPRWTSSLPPAVLFNGAVVDIIDAVEAVLVK